MESEDHHDDYNYSYISEQEQEEKNASENNDEDMEIVLYNIENGDKHEKKSEASQKQLLLSLREKTIQQCSEITCTERDESIRILISFKWDINKISRNWFNEVENNRKNIGIDLLCENKILEKNDFINCPICFEVMEKSKFFSLKCGHPFCFECWKNCLVAKLDYCFESVYAKCLQQGCIIYVPESVFIKFLEGDENCLEKYEEIVLKNFSEQNSNVKMCPSKCGRFVNLEEIASGKDIECECSYAYCKKCLRESHL